MANSITPKTFINTVFPPDLLLPDERPALACPSSFISAETGAPVEYYRQWHPSRRGLIPVGQRATYYCVSTVQRQRQRQIRKRLEDVRTAWVLVCDDWGTKAQRPDVPASFEIETSAGNFQGGYLIEPFDVSSPAGQAYYDSVLYSLAEAGYNDPGCRSASRLVRLPGSLHKTGFVAAVTSWHPERVWDLKDLAAAFDIPLKTPRKTFAMKPGKYTRLEDVQDPVYHWLADNSLIWGHNDQWVYLECPWRDAHTDGAQGHSSTAYSPMDYGRAGVGFKCLHGHCAKRGVDDFMTEILRRRNSRA